jgi:hypothetical protein
MSTTDERIFGPRFSWRERAQRAAENTLVHLREAKEAWNGLQQDASDRPKSSSDERDRAQQEDERDRAQQGDGAGEADDSPRAQSSEDADNPRRDEAAVEATTDSREEKQGSADDRKASRPSDRSALRSLAIKAAPIAVAALWARKRAQATRRRRTRKKIRDSLAGAVIGSAAVKALSDGNLKRVFGLSKRGLARLG